MIKIYSNLPFSPALSLAALAQEGHATKWLKLATKQLKAPKLLRKKFNQE